MPKIPEKEILWQAAEELEKTYEQSDPDLAVMVRDAKFFTKYMDIAINNAPFANAILGAMLLGWQLREKTAELEASKIITDLQGPRKKVHLA